MKTTSARRAYEPRKNLYETYLICHCRATEILREAAPFTQASIYLTYYLIMRCDQYSDNEGPGFCVDIPRLPAYL